MIVPAGPEANHAIAFLVVDVLMSTLVAVGVGLLFLLARNHWVARERIRWIEYVHGRMDQQFIHGFVGYCVDKGVTYRQLDQWIQQPLLYRLSHAIGPYDGWIKKFWCFKVEHLMADQEAYRFVQDTNSALNRRDYRGVIIWALGRDPFHDPGAEIRVN